MNEDIGKPQQAFLDVADRLTGSILDPACGTGENALYFVGLGCQVTGIDCIEEAINRARRKAAERGLSSSGPTMPCALLPVLAYNLVQHLVAGGVDRTFRA